jgi:hypothetical protein
LGAIAGARTQAWENVFLKEAVERLQRAVNGYTLSTRDVKDFMEVRLVLSDWRLKYVLTLSIQMCAYETVSVGYSAFCDLFTEDEWRGFQYRYFQSIWSLASAT